MSRNRAGLEKAILEIQQLRADFHVQVKVTGGAQELNPELEKAARLIDFLEMAELMCVDALQRAESCGAHFREEFQSPDGEAQRNDEEFSYVSAWEYQSGNKFELHKEELRFEYVQPTLRSYK